MFKALRWYWYPNDTVGVAARWPWAANRLRLHFFLLSTSRTLARRFSQFQRRFEPQRCANFVYPGRLNFHFFPQPPYRIHPLSLELKLTIAECRKPRFEIMKRNSSHRAPLAYPRIIAIGFIRTKGFRKVDARKEGGGGGRGGHGGVGEAVILLSMQIRHVPRGIVRGFISPDEGLVLNIRFCNTFLSLIKLRLYT